MSEALDRSAAALSERFGDNPADWRWGEAHQAEMPHLVWDRIPLIGGLLAIRVPNGGGPSTINAAAYAWDAGVDNFPQTSGPSLRAVYDLADLDNSVFIHAPGQSGNPLSPHYDDLVVRWRDHEPFRIPEAKAGAGGRLLLVPSGAPVSK